MSLLRIIGLSLALAMPALSQDSYGQAPAFWSSNPAGPQQTAAPKGTVSKVEFLGNVTAPNSRSSRDCGTHGQVGKFQISSFGDTTQCKEGAQLDNCWEGQNFVGSNTAALETDNPLIVQDFNLTGGDRAQQFCPKMDLPIEQDNVFFAIGISNVVETADNVGIVFTSANNRTVEKGQPVQRMLGAGIGHIDASGDFPSCTRTEQYWWDASKEPLWGDHGAVDGMDGYIYFYGSMNSATTISDQLNVFIGRVQKTQATNLDAYQYWNGQAYTNERLINPSPSQAAMQGVPPGQVYWNPYLFSWVSLTRDPLDMWGLDIQTSAHLHGPWSKMMRVYNETDLNPQPISIYSPAAHTQFDPSGQTLVVTYAAWGPISAIKLHFSK